MPEKGQAKKWVVYLSTFPPRECGIATFTQDLMESFDEMYKPREEAKVVAMNYDETSQYTYDKKKVIYQIPQPNEKRYAQAAKYLNSLDHVSLVHVQHEFGIFGGKFGSHLILFLRELIKPVAVTFHTVLPSPDPEMKDVVRAIDNHVQSVIVMTDRSRALLIDEYGLDARKIVVIPHGIHAVGFSDGNVARQSLGLAQDEVIVSTFGLLGRGKGIEYGIEAMAKVVKKHPKTKYLIIGATHPVVLKNEGEVYRNSLTKEVHELGLEDHVFFYDRYIELPELLCFLDATNIYLALSQNPDQAVSGTLSYALGSGRPVVSTSFAQAREDVDATIGSLVGFGGADGIADAISSMVSDPDRRSLMGKNAYFKTRSRTWPNIMLRHMTEYIRLASSLGDEEENLPKIKLDHISDLTDDFGMIQFAKLLTPDLASGYTTDDNARALVAVIKYYEVSSKKKALPLIRTYLNFLKYVQKGWVGGFHNYVDIDRQIPIDQHIKENLESTSARALYALAVTASSSSLPRQLRHTAEALFRKHLHLLDKVISPRSIAYGIKALYEWHRSNPSPDNLNRVRVLADNLIKEFEPAGSPDWRWFEDILAYSNGIMPDALIDAYRMVKDEKCLSIARETLDFLISHSFDGNVCMPVGQRGWLKRGGKKSLHDQQPEEVAVLVSALKSMYGITRDEMYARRMRQAFNWFLGNNTLHRVVYDQESGGCYDGVGEKEINLNQGAESTVMYLLARLELE